MDERIFAGGSLAAIRHGLAAVRGRSAAQRRRRARHASGSRETGFTAAGSRYYTWQEELRDAEAWAASLAPLDRACRSGA